jgi:hypothetical protein
MDRSLMTMKKTIGLLFGLFVASPWVGARAAGQPLLVDAPTVMLAPGHLIVRTLVDPDPANGAIQVVTESPDFYRRSEMQLDGNAAPRTSTFEYADLPRGTYEIHAVLLDAHGGQRAAVVRRLDVIPRTGH